MTTPPVRWDDSAMRSAYADVFSVRCTRERLTLDFGVEQARDAEHGDVTARLSSRVALHPSTAKRLLAALERVLEAAAPILSRVERMSPAALRPIQLANELGAGYILGASFKMSHRTLRGNRFLLTIAKNRIRPRADERVFDACIRMGIPEALRGPLAERLPAANYVHVGFEETDRGCLYKVYLEFWTTWERELEIERRAEPFVGGFGFKWDPADPRRSAVTRYTCHPLISVDDMLARVSAICDRPESRTALDVTGGILARAARRIPAGKMLYLEADEEPGPRRSFDINLLRAKMSLAELHPLLRSMTERYAIDPDAFRALHAPIRDQPFSHIQGGVDREGRDFATIYYAVEKHQ